MTKKGQDKTRGTDQSVMQETALEGIKDLIVSQMSKDTISKVGSILGQFAERDHEQEQQSLAAGEIFAKVLALPLATQKAIVWAWADQFGVAKPSYESAGVGRKTKGRNELAQVLYGRWPDMLEKKGANKDTPAAKRITDHIRRYQISAGVITPTPRQNIGAAHKKSFQLLWAEARKYPEVEQFHRMTTILYHKLFGIDLRTLDKWSEYEMSTERFNEPMTIEFTPSAEKAS
jgi:hypothetical protein